MSHLDVDQNLTYDPALEDLAPGPVGSQDEYYPLRAGVMRNLCHPDFARHLGPLGPFVGYPAATAVAMAGVKVGSIDVKTRGIGTIVSDIAEAIVYLADRADFEGKGEGTRVLRNDVCWLKYWNLLRQSMNPNVSKLNRPPVLAGMDLWMERWVYWSHQGYFVCPGGGVVALDHSGHGYDRMGVDLFIYQEGNGNLPVGAIDVKNRLPPGRDLDVLPRSGRMIWFVVSQNVSVQLPLAELYIGGGFPGTEGCIVHRRLTALRMAEAILSDMLDYSCVLPDEQVLLEMDEVLGSMGCGRTTCVYGLNLGRRLDERRDFIEPQRRNVS